MNMMARNYTDAQVIKPSVKLFMPGNTTLDFLFHKYPGTLGNTWGLL